MINFGSDIGTKNTLARITPNYNGPELVGRQVIAQINTEPKQIGQHLSECLLLGLADEDNNLVIVHPEKNVPLGGKLH